MNISKLFLSTLLASLATGAHGYAGVLNTVSEIDGVTNGGTTIASQSNLLTSATLTSPDFVPYDNGFGDSSISVLNDGSLGSNGVHGNETAEDLSGSAWTLNVALSAKSDITSISVISGWNADVVNFDYTLSYSTDGGTTYHTPPVGTFLAKETGVTGNFNGTADSLAAYGAVSLESTLTGLDLTGVTNLQFTFNPTDSTSTFFGNPGTYDGAIREVEAFGVAEAPEPSTTALILSGMGALFFVMRRQRASKI